MAFAAALPIITAAIGAVSSVVGGISAYQQGKSNAKLAERNAEISRKQAELRTEEIDRDRRQRTGSITAAYGANGISTDVGSPLDVLDYSVRLGEIDKQNALYQGNVQAYGYDVEASQARASGRSGLVSGLLGAVSPALSAGSGIAGLKAGADTSYNASVAPKLINSGFIPTGF